MKTDRGKISRAEIIILAAILAAAVLIFAVLKFSENSAKTAEINYRGAVFTVSIVNDSEFTLREITGEADAPDMTFEIKGGEIAVISSDCPGNDCVHTGFIPGRGRVIVCLPNRVTVTVGDKNIIYDAVV
jgi:hypothetical protein